MTAPADPVMDFLLTRRSRPAKTLQAPAPDRAALQPLLTAAARAPDHGKLEPWRFMVLAPAACARFAAAISAHAAEHGLEGDKQAGAFLDSPLCVAVVASPKESAKIPQVEQTLSAGAVCLGLVNAALAAGWGANWLSGWPAHTPELTGPALGVTPPEHVAGFIHIGTAERAPPERPRPDIDAITEWVTR